MFKRRRIRVASSFAGLGLFLCAWISVPAVSTSGRPQGTPVLFSADQFGKTDLVPNQSTSEAGTLLETLNGLTDRFEPMSNFRLDDKFRRLGRSIGRLDILLRSPDRSEGVATCTSALIDKDKIITNYHCVPGRGPGEIQKLLVHFGFLELGTQGALSFPVELTPVEADAALDFSILQVRTDSRALDLPALRLDPVRSAIRTFHG
jgi:hypothetical protein